MSAPSIDDLVAGLGRLRRDVGVLAEVFRQRPGTRVSNNPEGRFAASGADADLATTDVHDH